MIRSLMLGLALLYSVASYSQSCEELLCQEGIAHSLEPVANGVCLSPIPAVDFLAEGLSDCAETFTLAVYTAEEVAAAGTDFAPDFSGERDTLWVTDLFDETTLVQLFALMMDGSTQSCTSFLLTQAPSGDWCWTNQPTLTGMVQTEDDEDINQVMVHLNGGWTDTYVTTIDGYYTHGIVPLWWEYNLIPSRTDNPLNGVTTLDMILISKHILGIQPLDSPYKRIAADVNQSGTVSVADLIQIRRLILNLITEFPASNSWRFISADYIFPNPENPWQEVFPEWVRFFVDGHSTDFEFDFIGVKVGDVNGSATTQ